MNLKTRGFLLPAVLWVALWVAVIGIAQQQTADWPMFRGNAALTGVTPSGLPQSPALLWNFQAKDSIESSAAIANGMAYFGSMDAALYAVHLTNGKLAWRYQTENPIQESSPCVCEGMVYVGDLGGVLHAVDAATGKIRWKFKTEGEIKSSPNCYQGRIYFGSYDQNLYCLSAANGALLWKFSAEGPVHSTPSIGDGMVYIAGCDETFRAVNLRTGKQAYSVPLGAYTGASAAFFDRFAYVGTFANEVLAIDLQKRSVQWNYSHPTRRFPFYSSGAVTKDYFVLGGRDKLVHCIHRLSGKSVWTFPTRARVDSSPLIAGNRVFIGSSDGVLYGLDLASGKKVWEFTAGAPLSASPAAAGGFMVIGSQDGTLYCFGKQP